MAFAQYYYDPALEFERALDDESRDVSTSSTTAALLADNCAANSKSQSTELMFVAQITVFSRHRRSSYSSLHTIVLQVIDCFDHELSAD